MDRATISTQRRGALLRMTRLALATAGGGALAACDRISESFSREAGFRGTDITGAEYGRDFRLTDTEGRVRTLKDFHGQVVLLYFGFVQCPDICPTSLARAAEVKRMLKEDGKRFQVIFVTVDPERDTPEMLREYMAAFDPSFVALRGTPEELATTAAEFKVIYNKVPTGSSYTMDHSAQSYLFDPNGHLRVVLSHYQLVQDYTHDVERLLRTS